MEGEEFTDLFSQHPFVFSEDFRDHFNTILAKGLEMIYWTTIEDIAFNYFL